LNSWVILGEEDDDDDEAPLARFAEEEEEEEEEEDDAGLGFRGVETRLPLDATFDGRF
jgi:hypothetical protein